jgi:hypothetical protein
VAVSDQRPAPEPPAQPGRRAFLGSAALAAAGCTADGGPGSPVPGRRVPFLGRHQPGVDTPAARFGLLAAFNLASEDRGRLARTLRDLTDEARGLMRPGRPNAATAPSRRPRPASSAPTCAPTA